MRPLIIGFPYAADRFGGSNASSMVLARALLDAGHTVHVLAHGDGPVVAEANRLQLPVHHLPPLSGIPGYARPDRFRLEQMLAFNACREALRRLNIDIVHTNDCGMLRTWTFPTLAHPTTLVAHWRTNFRKSWSVAAGLRVARAIVAVSHYSFAQLPLWAKAKTSVEYNPFDLSVTPEQKQEARNAVRNRLGVAPDAAIVGVFGNHIERKRTHVLADVLNAISETSDGRPVVGLACGAAAAPCDTLLDEKIAAFGLERRLFRPGFVRPVEEWMTACDVILAPAIREPLARSVLEAQALEIPVVVSSDGGLRELIEHGRTGLLCDPFDTESWIEATRRLLEHRDEAASLAGAARRVVEQMKPARHAERIAGLYRDFHKTQTGRAAA